MSDNTNTLYHYTDSNGLLGILEGKKLWLMQIGFMNDALEVKYGLSIVKKSLEDHNLSKSEDLFEELPLRIFLASFSSHRDLLSQWRAYADDGAGFAIGFDKKQLSDSANSQNCRLKEVEYEVNKQQEASNQICKNFSQAPDTSIDLYEFFSLIPSWKSPGFGEEDEWRIVNGHGPADFAGCKFRVTKFGIAPYRIFEFPCKAVVEVVCGPKNPMRAARHRELKAFLGSCGFDRWESRLTESGGQEVRITDSEVSYQ